MPQRRRGQRAFATQTRKPVGETRFGTLHSRQLSQSLRMSRLYKRIVLILYLLAFSLAGRPNAIAESPAAEFV
jgi:hypothetical protein